VRKIVLAYFFISAHFSGNKNRPCILSKYWSVESRTDCWIFSARL